MSLSSITVPLGRNRPLSRVARLESQVAADTFHRIEGWSVHGVSNRVAQCIESGPYQVRSGRWSIALPASLKVDDAEISATAASGRVQVSPARACLALVASSARERHPDLLQVIDVGEYAALAIVVAVVIGRGHEVDTCPA